MENKIKICHVTSAHKDGDVRIFHKECVSLAQAGFDVYHLVPNSTTRIEKGVQIVSFPFEISSRFKRMFFLVKEIYRRALEIDADVYHLHDPELLRIALKLKKQGKKVIYDAHEDVPRDILTKSYIPSFLRKTVSRRFEKFENKVAGQLDGIICATPFIRDRFKKINPKTIDINNFPLIGEIEFAEIPWESRLDQVCYIGVITKIRGILEMVRAAEISGVKLKMAGTFDENSKDLLKNEKGMNMMDELGMINRVQSVELKKLCKAGLVIFHPVPNHIDAQPNKIFEYMASGLPVIGSNFPLWKEIIEQGGCGICVDPMKPEAISQAIKTIIENPEKSSKMGANGIRLVKEKYNWDAENVKLVAFYKGL